MNNVSSKLHRFHGGLRLPEHKAQSMSTPIRTAPIPKQLSLPLQQHIGEPATPIVNVGERVLKNQVIAQAEGYVSAPIHASSSGTVVAIEARSIPHPSGMPGSCIVIETDGNDMTLPPASSEQDYRNDDPSHLRNRIREAGIVGLGGAGFPSFIKLNPGPKFKIDTVILNGAECEPYISCDAMLMQERARGILDGLNVMRHALQANRCLIGIEDNKSAAIAALQAALTKAEHMYIEIIAVPTIYPGGGEKQLIKTLTGLEVPTNALPASLGVVCHNVATAYAVGNAILHNQPLIERVVTVTGGAVTSPANYRVRIGTAMRDLLEWAGEQRQPRRRLIMGGPMMGFVVQNQDAPVIKTTNCVLSLTQSELTPQHTAMPCIRCGQCAEVCPAQLLPQQLYWYARANDFDGTQRYNLFDCIECGCCSYVCPSHIPLVQYYRYAKAEIWAKEREKQHADRARERHEFLLLRQERKKLEDDARKRKKKELLDTLDNGTASKQSEIAAALQRVKEKKANHSASVKNIDNLTDEQRKMIEEVERRRAQKRQSQVPSGEDRNL